MIGDDGVVVVPHGIPDAPFFMPADNKRGLKELTSFLKRYPDARVTLVADNLAQDYRTDDLPRLNFLDRAKLAKRRLKQAFPSARLSSVLPFKNTPNRILMAGVHDSNPVFVWAERLQARLPDIALLPVEGARAAALLMPESRDGWSMMISRQRTGGFRQIVTYKNDLVFTRLTPLPPAGADDEADIIARDIKASLDYLSRYGMKNAEELSLLLLMPHDLHLAPAIKNLPLKSVRSITPFGAAKILGLSSAPKPDEPSSDILFGALLASRMKARLSLMLPDVKGIWLAQRLREWGLRASVASLLLALGAVLWSAGDLASTLYETRKMAALLQKTRETFESAKTSAAPLTGPSAQIRQALEKRRIFEQKGLLPWSGLKALAQGLDADSRIVKLRWKNDLSPAVETFIVSLRVTSDSDANDRASIVAAFDKTAQNIARAMPDYDVAVVKPPYPSLPGEAVTASAGDMSSDPIGELSIQRKAP